MAIGLCDTATEGLWPDLAVLIRLDPEAGLARAAGEDRFEAEGVSFQREVADAYEEIAAVASDRVAVIDGAGTVEEVHARVMEAVQARQSQAGEAGG
jgi:dTMP kinase